MEEMYVYLLSLNGLLSVAGNKHDSHLPHSLVAVQDFIAQGDF